MRLAAIPAKISSLSGLVSWGVMASVMFFCVEAMIAASMLVIALLLEHLLDALGVAIGYVREIQSESTVVVEWQTVGIALLLLAAFHLQQFWAREA